MLTFDIKGMKALQEKQEQMVRDLKGTPMLNAMRSATLLVQRDAKRNAPVDTGRLRNSITPVVRVEGLANVVGMVGTRLHYAPYMEFGTGIPAGRPFRHWPPASALEVWAERHGMNAYVVARAIGMRGGLEPREFLQNAFKDNQEKIKGLIGNAVSGIVRK